MKIRKGDKVILTAGSNKGQEGVVEKVYPKSNSVIVGGANLYKKHVRKSEQFPTGGLIELPRRIDVAKVALLDPKKKVPTRIRFEIQDGKKMRVAVKSGTVLKN